MGKKIGQLSVLVFILLLLVVAVSCAPPSWDNWSREFPFNWSPIIGFPFGVLTLAIYFLPTIIAAVTHAKSIVGIILLNVLAGWTFVGWVIALVWSLIGTKQRT